MAKDYAAQPYTQMRRDERAVTDEDWMKRMLHTAPIGVLATVYEGQPFINTNLFVYDEAQHCIYTHTALRGRTRANVELNETASFSVMEMGRLLPAPEALEFSVEYAGIMAFGRAHVVTDQAEALNALQMIMDKYAAHLEVNKDYREPIPEEEKRTTVMRFDIDQWSGKKKEVDEHDGAYWFPEQPMLASVRERYNKRQDNVE